MSSRVVRYRPGAGAPEPDSSALARRFAAIRTELHVPEGFPADVLAEAQQAAARPGQAPASAASRPSSAPSSTWS